MTGGAPTRLTWHPGADMVQGFTPDGKSVLFTSQRATFTTRYAQLFTVPVAGRHRGGAADPQRRARDLFAGRAADRLQPARRALPAVEALSRRHAPRGSGCTDVKGHAVEKIPQPAGRANDTDPMWIGDTVYFRSDRDGEFNLFAFDTKSKAGSAAHPLRRLPGADRFVRGRPHRLRAGRLPAPVRSAWRNREEADDRRALGSARDAAAVREGREVGPRRGAVADRRARGVRVPRRDRHGSGREGRRPEPHQQHGGARALAGVVARRHDRSRSSRTRRRVLPLYIGSQDGKGEPRAITRQGRGLLQRPGVVARLHRRSPSSTTRQSVYWVDVESGVSKKVASQPLYGPVVVISYSWSPDSKWLAYTIGQSPPTSRPSTPTRSSRTSRSRSPTASATSATRSFDASGKYLFFLGSTDAGPVNDWFAQSSADMRVDVAASIWRCCARTCGRRSRRRATRRRRARTRRKTKRSQTRARKTPRDRCPKTSRQRKDAAVPHRLRRPPVPHPRSADCRPATSRTCRPAPPGRSTTCKTVGRRDVGVEPLRPRRRGRTRRCCRTSAATSCRPTARSCSTRSDRHVVDRRRRRRRSSRAEGRLNVDGIEVRVDPRAEWKQIFDEAWRINRDYFYAPNMHGVDWPAMQQRSTRRSCRTWPRAATSTA